MFNANEIGKQFIKLVQVKDTELAEDVKEYDGEETYLLDYYVADEEGGCVAMEQLADTVEDVDIIDTILIMGSTEGTRCYTNKAQALLTEAGDYYMDYAFYDTVFA